MEYDKDGDGEEEDPDDEYEEYPIYVARPDIAVSANLIIDPALLQTNAAPDLGNIGGDDFDLQQLQYPWE